MDAVHLVLIGVGQQPQRNRQDAPPGFSILFPRFHGTRELFILGPTSTGRGGNSRCGSSVYTASGDPGRISVVSTVAN
ncbi:hypothetical protein BV898_12995 [Hypsibius exemplaris]|uniref:Uncharacterized protein n=1 Tax=Hypsibius exemplaris TaxID=2072580 RepID=A0A1W0WC27_HYPEX|nr:hypothetical protein BV898_12995 [Hypsibius exemplaris]